MNAVYRGSNENIELNKFKLSKNEKFGATSFSRLTYLGELSKAVQITKRRKILFREEKDSLRGAAYIIKSYQNRCLLLLSRFIFLNLFGAWFGCGLKKLLHDLLFRLEFIIFLLHCAAPPRSPASPTLWLLSGFAFTVCISNIWCILHRKKLIAGSEYNGKKVASE